MKKGLVVVLAFMLIGMIACDDNSKDPSPSGQAKISEAQAIAKEGQWIITYFWDTDKDETASFSGYTFEFAANGTITATKGATVVTGQWSVTDEDSDDDVDENVDFNLIFTTPANFEDLTEDWHIIFISNTKIELTHVSGGNGGTDFLTFEKN